jgi:hypothetical protein
VTPVPFDLPLRPSEAAEVAFLVFSLAERKPLNDELRSRVAARLAALRLETLRPWPGSLERDPVHHSTYYMAVDGQDGRPLLLHMAPAAAPTSAIFSKPLLIGRMRRPGGQEIVLNAIPFDAADHANLERFVAQIDPAFLPRPPASRTVLVAAAIPAAFDGFRAIWKAGGRNLAAIAMAPGETDPAGFYYRGVWAAIRAGWREGYSAGIGMALAAADPEVLRETIRQAAPLSRFAIDVSDLVGAEDREYPVDEFVRSFDGGTDWKFTAEEVSALSVKYGPALKAAERAHELIRQARAARKIARPFDFELSLERAAEPTTAHDLVFCLAWLKARGHAAQLAAPAVGPATDLSALAAAARFCQCTLSLDARAGDPASIARATAGRVSYRLPAEMPDYTCAMIETAAQLSA